MKIWIRTDPIWIKNEDGQYCGIAIPVDNGIGIKEIKMFDEMTDDEDISDYIQFPTYKQIDL
ncbi:MAG: hypothetical protein MJZ34_05515 [Paludibacteraceae bacterium]|nr:hypothetical protein [Paludibacteraceae bacterium]